MSKNLGSLLAPRAESVKPRASYGPIYFLLMADLIIAAIVLGAWNLVSPFVGGAAEWATGQAVHHSDWSDVLDYSYALLWQIPLAGSLVSWLAIKSNARQLAFLGAAMPVVLFCFSFGWFVWAPMQYH